MRRRPVSRAARAGAARPRRSGPRPPPRPRRRAEALVPADRRPEGPNDLLDPPLDCPDPLLGIERPRLGGLGRLERAPDGGEGVDDALVDLRRAPLDLALAERPERRAAPSPPWPESRASRAPPRSGESARGGRGAAHGDGPADGASSTAARSALPPLGRDPSRPTRRARFARQRPSRRRGPLRARPRSPSATAPGRPPSASRPSTAAPRRPLRFACRARPEAARSVRPERSRSPPRPRPRAGTASSSSATVVSRIAACRRSVSSSVSRAAPRPR